MPAEQKGTSALRERFHKVKLLGPDEVRQILGDPCVIDGVQQLIGTRGFSDIQPQIHIDEQVLFPFPLMGVNTDDAGYFQITDAEGVQISLPPFRTYSTKVRVGWFKSISNDPDNEIQR